MIFKMLRDAPHQVAPTARRSSLLEVADPAWGSPVSRSQAPTHMRRLLSTPTEIAKPRRLLLHPVNAFAGKTNNVKTWRRKQLKMSAFHHTLHPLHCPPGTGV